MEANKPIRERQTNGHIPKRILRLNKHHYEDGKPKTAHYGGIAAANSKSL